MRDQGLLARDWQGRDVCSGTRLPRTFVLVEPSCECRAEPIYDVLSELMWYLVNETSYFFLSKEDGMVAYKQLLLLFVILINQPVIFWRGS